MTFSSRTGKPRIAVIGGGKMGEAIMGGWIASDLEPAAGLSADDFIVANPGQPRRDHLSQTYGVSCMTDASLIDRADVVLIAVKPQKTAEVLQALAACSYAADAFFISVVAGWTAERLESYLPAGVRLVRVMPNTPLLVGAGATAVCGGSAADAHDVEWVRGMFACLGKAWVVDEGKMDAVSAVSGSGPAYVAALIEALTSAAANAGLPPEMGEQLATQTVLGTALLMDETGQGAEKTRVDVCSPGGSTLAALAAMEQAGFSLSLEKGVSAAIARSVELGKL